MYTKIYIFVFPFSHSDLKHGLIKLGLWKTVLVWTNTVLSQQKTKKRNLSVSKKQTAAICRACSGVFSHMLVFSFSLLLGDRDDRPCLVTNTVLAKYLLEEASPQAEGWPHLLSVTLGIKASASFYKMKGIFSKVYKRICNLKKTCKNHVLIQNYLFILIFGGLFVFNYSL